MREPQQLCLLPEAEDMQPSRPVEYVAPDTDVIRQYAHKVCRQLSELDDQDYTGTDYTRGLTTFLQVVIKAETRHLNRGVKHVK